MSRQAATVTAKTIGVGNYPWPVSWLDENGMLQGYEIEVLKAVNRILPQYEFCYVATDLASILEGLDIGAFALGAHALTWTEQRGHRYLAAAESYGSHNYKIIVSKGRRDLASLKDLEGKTVATKPGSAEIFHLEQYNRTVAKEPIRIAYESMQIDDVVQSLSQGLYDARVAPAYSFALYDRAYPGALEQVGPDNIIPGAYCHFLARGEWRLQNDISAALHYLKTTGILSYLNKKHLQHTSRTE